MGNWINRLRDAVIWRDKNALRSWRRRIRLALLKDERLTPADVHEIVCVWIAQARHRGIIIDSPAMDKMRGRRWPKLGNEVPVRQFLRAKFDAHGQPLPRKKRPHQIAQATLQAAPTLAPSLYAQIIPPAYATQILVPQAHDWTIAGVALSVRRAVAARPTWNHRPRL